MLKLSEQEKQEILRHLETDRELPDKYRFLLFEHKPEVELVWNGKTNATYHFVFPFHGIKNCDEVAACLEKLFPELAGATLTIHTKNNGDISEVTSGKSKAEPEQLRESRSQRPIGLAKGVFQVPPEFFDPLPEDILNAFEGK